MFGPRANVLLILQASVCVAFVGIVVKLVACLTKMTGNLYVCRCCSTCVLLVVYVRPRTCPRFFHNMMCVRTRSEISLLVAPLFANPFRSDLQSASRSFQMTGQPLVAAILFGIWWCGEEARDRRIDPRALLALEDVSRDGGFGALVHDPASIGQHLA